MKTKIIYLVLSLSFISNASALQHVLLRSDISKTIAKDCGIIAAMAGTGWLACHLAYKKLQAAQPVAVEPVVDMAAWRAERHAKLRELLPQIRQLESETLDLVRELKKKHEEFFITYADPVISAQIMSEGKMQLHGELIKVYRKFVETSESDFETWLAVELPSPDIRDDLLYSMIIDWSGYLTYMLHIQRGCGSLKKLNTLHTKLWKLRQESTEINGMGAYMQHGSHIRFLRDSIGRELAELRKKRKTLIPELHFRHHVPWESLFPKKATQKSNIRSNVNFWVGCALYCMTLCIAKRLTERTV